MKRRLGAGAPCVHVGGVGVLGGEVVPVLHVTKLFDAHATGAGVQARDGDGLEVAGVEIPEGAGWQLGVVEIIGGGRGPAGSQGVAPVLLVIGGGGVRDVGR